MRQAFLIALMLVVLSVFGKTLGAATGASEILDQARTLVANREYQKAAALLEEGLPGSPPADRGDMIGLLRQAYQNLINQAEASGKAREAAEYRDNLAILEQVPARPSVNVASPNPAHAPDPSPALPASAATDPRPQPADSLPIPRSSASPDQQPFKEPSSLPEPAPLPALERPGSAGTDSHPVIPPPNKVPARGIPALQAGAGIREVGDATTPAKAAEEPHSRPEHDGETPAGSTQFLSSNSELAQADRWFTDKKYAEAGQAYARLAAQNQLPVQRKQVWAYCRWVAVVALINAHPQSDREWDDIEQEVRSIQKLTPGNWYGEYLQNRVAEARRGGRGSARAGKLVVRGSAPDENPPPRFPRLLARAQPAPVAPQGAMSGSAGEQPLGLPVAAAPQDPHPESQPAAPSGGAPAPDGDQGSQPGSPAGAVAVQQSGQESGVRGAENTPAAPLSWHVRETANFRIYHTDPVQAEQAAQAAEAVRTQQARRWGSSAARAPWSPRCDIYLYPTPKDFAQLTGQPETSPGFSTMAVNGNRIVARRVNLRADHPQLLAAILPHEVTHVVLADLFTQQQIPRWADEGMAVLAEPPAEQASRASELTEPLREGRVFKLSELMAIDYPSAEAWNLYYAQSVSLTQFLVEQGNPEQFVSFVRSAQRKGVEIALRESYHIEGFAELENRWQTFARRQAAEITTSSRDAPPHPTVSGGNE
ncbi:MAG: peptidase MA family metallohydrolase [Isosphaeraceae bacterium]